MGYEILKRGVSMSKVFLPEGYTMPLSVYEMQRAIEFIKSNFQVNLGNALTMVCASAASADGYESDAAAVDQTAVDGGNKLEQKLLVALDACGHQTVGNQQVQRLLVVIQRFATAHQNNICNFSTFTNAFIYIIPFVQ